MRPAPASNFALIPFPRLRLRLQPLRNYAEMFGASAIRGVREPAMKPGWSKLLGRLSAAGRASRAQTLKLLRAGQMALLQEHRQRLLDSPRMLDPRRLLKFGYRVYSQSDEDGILHEIFRRIGEGGQTFVELGSGYGTENNTRFLLMQGWRGLWLEGSARRAASAAKTLEKPIREGQLRIEQQFITAGNIDAAIAKHAPAKEVDLLSVDLDGNDYYVLDAIHSISPRAIVAEYNARFPADIAWTIEYNEAHEWKGTDYYGASLKALEMVLGKKGYALVGCNLLGTNAFFIRRDLASDPPFCSPFTAENHYEPPRYYLLPAFETGFPAGAGPFQLAPSKQNGR